MLQVISLGYQNSLRSSINRATHDSLRDLFAVDSIAHVRLLIVMQRILIVNSKG